MSNRKKNIELSTRRQGGFTLIELLIVIAIVGTLLGMLLPAIQKAREAANEEQAVRSLRLIGKAETDYNTNSSPHSFTGSFIDLGLVSLFPCVDPGCGTRQNGGYYFHIALGASGQTFTVEATPAVPGKTGSAKLTTDQTGGIFSAPTEGADAAREQMFANIRDRAVPTLSRLILQRPQDLPRIVNSLESRDTLPRAFGNLDVNGDSRVSFTDLQTYNGVGAAVISPFIAIITEEMQLGTGGEDVSLLPGVSLNDLTPAPVEPIPNPSPTPTRPPTRGIEVLELQTSLRGIANDPTAVEYLPAFGDGNVRVAPGGTLRLDDWFFSRLTQPDAAANPSVWAGTFTLNEINGNGINGILIGLLQPSSPSAASAPTLNALVLSTRGRGVWFGAVGFGDATINWGDESLNGPFTGNLRLIPAVQRGRPN